MNLPIDTPPTFLGYRLTERLYKGAKTIVYRGIRLAGNAEQNLQQSVAIKLLNREHPHFHELLQFRNQYTIAKNLQIPGIVRSYSLEPYRNSYALVMEDFGGISLRDYVQTQPLSLTEFLEIARQLADILKDLYHNQIIHKDIKPANILINPETKQVKLIDFSIASLLPKETQEIKNPNVLEGTLAYLSPEQTGRMNRGIDYRSDFYSLGVTFYELLTGKVPFQVEDPLDLVHCHLAKSPAPVHEIKPDVPLVLSQIVAKLMAKNAENRYQSALGLKYDLEACLTQLQETGTITPFKIAQRDRSSHFLIPEKLYGRETEVQTLLDAFERISQGSTELMLVAGFSGIGKTAVINEVHKPIVRQKGYFIKGKYDQFQRNIPLSAFVQAFQDLMGQLLSESDTQLQQWKEKILQAIGENGQVIIEVIPELERLIGKQPAVVEISGSEAQNRFNLVFQNFVQVFTRVEHPLVIFLDDLQWADSASLKLFQVLMNDAGYLLLLGAYRDNEVSPVHPLMLTVKELEKTGAVINTITLQPLSQTNINQWVADTLNCNLLLAESLTELVYQKTKGNPFFTTQFLKALYEDQFIQFNSEAGYWQCDISQIKVQSLTDDVVEFMAQQLQKLPQETQQVLRLAACIGAQFDLQTLAVVSEQSEVEAAAALWKALQEGFIVPLNETYKFFQEATGDTEITQTIAIPYRFLHDRVQQAAYSLIPETERAIAHYQIGQLLLRQMSPEALEEQIFVVVNQLNYGTALIKNQTERDQLALRNLSACRKARVATAYQAALNYAVIALNLLGKKAWKRRYEMTLTLHELAAEVASLCGQFEQMNQWFEAVINQVKNPLEKVRVYIVKIQALASQNKFGEAISNGQLILKELGVQFPDSPTSEDIQQAIQEINVLIAEQPIEELFHLGAMVDAKKLATVEIAASIMPACYLTGSPLFPLLNALQVNLSIQYGNSPISAYSYANYGVILNHFIKDVTTGDRFSRLAYRLASEADGKNIRPVTFAVIGSQSHRKSHLRETLPILLAGYQAGLETGKLEYLGYAIGIGFSLNSFWCGQPLAELEPQIRAYRQELLNFKQLTAANYCAIVWETILFLLGNQDQIELSFAQTVDEEKLFSQLVAANDLYRVFSFYLHRAMLRFLLGNIAQATADAIRAREYMAAGAGLIIEVGLYFYDSLIALASVTNSAAELTAQQQRVQENQAELYSWAEHAPMNHLHKWQLVEAEKYRVLGQKAEAIELYDRAIANAKKNGYLQEEAIANELAAKFYLDWGKEKVAAAYLQEAYYCYSHWGSRVKTEDLEKRYPQLLAPIFQVQENYLRLNEPLSATIKQSSAIYQTIQANRSSSDRSISNSLDFASILKASQALSSEIQLEQLLSTLVEVVMKNTGADKSALILLKGGHLVIEAIAVLGRKDTTMQASVLQSISVELSQDVPVSIINYVSRTHETVVIDNAIAKKTLAADAYVQTQEPKSLLCTPIIKRGKLIGILYLENNLTAGVFTRDRLQIINLLMSQAAISLENAKLYTKLEKYSSNLEKKVQKRTQELQKKATQLESTLQKLYSTQSQLIQTEKMSSLGQLVAGIAHEINNPVNFIYGNLTYTSEYIQSLIELIELYQQFYPQPQSEIQEKIEKIDLEFIITDLPKLLGSMQIGSDRIRQIVSSLRNFSRLDESEIKPVDIHSGIDSALLILQHRLKIANNYPEIQVIKHYGQLPLINCYASALNQVFMNILSNAIDALQQEMKNDFEANKHPTITIQTSINNSQNLVINITDNGPGMSKSVLNKIFDPFFTTKPVGSGTGLGLSISYSIVVEKHRGKLSCISAPGKGAEFIIEIPL